MTLGPAVTGRITQAVEDGVDDQVALTQDLVRMPSLRGAEHAVQDRVAREMRHLGLRIDRIPL